MQQSNLRTALIRSARNSKSPGAVAYVGDLENTYFHYAVGKRQLEPRSKSARKDTLYDLASLTKVVATTTAVMLLRRQGVMDLDQPVTEFVPIRAFKKITIRHLITHTAGLVPYIPYLGQVDTVDEILERYARDGIEHEPGVTRIYSDAGFMLLGRAVEIAAQDTLDAFCANNIFVPLGMTATAFNPPREWAKNCAATEYSKARGEIIVGTVHDDNAYAVGGVAGHAGLFSTASDLATFCRALLAERFLPEGVLAEMTRLGQVPFYPWQGLGWELDPWTTEKKGFLMSRSAFGHSGWTGTSLWLDGEKGLFAILLSNSCHPTREHRDNHTLRGHFHKAVSRTFYTPPRTNTHTGLDRIINEQCESFRDKTIALLTNSAAVDQLGRPILEALAMFDHVKIGLIYSPEHGFNRKAEAGEGVPSQDGALPIISLYGDRKAPTEQELAHIDEFVIDLPDIGARYFTYIATMKDVMAACARAGVPVLILDRPNPLGGEILEGPVAQNTDSAVSSAPIPVRHGMTLGETALYFQQTFFKDDALDLRVSLLDAWQPARLFDECALPWVAPSPNMPDPQTALLYVGTCLFEGVNLNEGRGTDTPFQIIGAPWLDADKIIKAIHPRHRQHFHLEAISYTPVSMPGKSTNPLYRDELCRGIRISIEDPRLARPFRLVVALLSAIQDRHPRRFEWQPYFDTLAGSTDLRRKIQDRQDPQAIINSFRRELGRFDKIRPRLYHLDPWEREETD